jgi:phage/plasmid-like protein (TIGR03299 family)
MLYIGETPWHREGVRGLDPEITPLAALAPAGLDHTYRGVPVQTTAGQNLPGYQAILRDDDRAYAVVSDGYTIVQPKALADFMEPFHESGLIKVETAGSLHDGATIWFLGSIQGGEAFVGASDPIRAYLLFANSYDGSMSVRITPTWTRVVCANTLAISLSEDASKGIAIKHTKTAHARIDAAQDVVRGQLAAFGGRIGEWRKLTAIPQAKGSGARSKQLRAYLAGVFGRPEILAQRKAAEKGGDSDRVEIVSTLLEQGRGADLPTAQGTAWGLYNALTEYMTHVQGRGDAGKAAQSRLDRNAWGEGARLMSRAESIAVELDSVFDLPDLVRLGVLKGSDLVMADGSVGGDK